MYDIHCHILPDFDDGASDLKTALEMARIAVADGITHLACTPHIYPGLFDYDSSSISSAVEHFRQELEKANIPLQLGMGADIQMVSEMVTRLKQGTMPTINNSRFMLFEPPHHIYPASFAESLHNVITNGYTPIITHPERLGWIEQHYDEFIAAVESGAWLQLTAGSLTGEFGARIQHMAEKLLGDGIVHVLATDAHNLTSRMPTLAASARVAAELLGDAEADALVRERPAAVWHNKAEAEISLPPAFEEPGVLSIKKHQRRGFLGKLLGSRN